MAEVSIQVELKALKLIQNVIRQLPFAASVAINDLGRQVRVAENAAMLTTFKHPRPFTAKSVLMNRSTKTSLSTEVYVRPEVAKYLLPYEQGGVHVLPGQALLKPEDIKLDQYGQLTKNTMNNLKARQDIFIGTITPKRGDPITGVWQRLSVKRTGAARKHRLKGGGSYLAGQGALKLLIRFGDAIPVKQHLGFHTRAIALITANAEAAFKAAFIQALSSSR